MNKKAQLAIIPIMMSLVIGMVAVAIVTPMITDSSGSDSITDDNFSFSDTCQRVTDRCIQAGTLTVENASNGASFTSQFDECMFLGERSGAKNNSDINSSGGTAGGQWVNLSYTEVNCIRLTGFTATIVNYVPILLAVGLMVFLAAFI